ncbi:amidohydrolase [Fretibacter rubidus]|uniref:amidohydrolase n=1 Tax=Fretibacter rubidus TaxID=570162 RepID=UPI00352BC2A4
MSHLPQKLLGLITGASLLALSACSTETSAPADAAAMNALSWCISGGDIYTADDNNPRADAVAVKDGEITYVGANTGDWCATHGGSSAQTVSLDGAAMYPGFTDAHGHLLGIGLREMTLNMEGVKSVTELQERLKTEVDATPTGETIYGRGWIETHWPEKRFPNRYDLDAVAPDNPVILERADGHAVVANSAALIAAGVGPDTDAPFGGDILKGDDGQPTGMLIDKADRLVMRLVASLTPERKEAAYIKGAELYASRGWANIHSMSVDPEDAPLLERLASEGKIGIRVYNSIDVLDGMKMDEVGRSSRFDSDLITTRAIKLYGDGALGSRGAALQLPYSDDPTNDGLLLITRQRIMPLLETALVNGIQVNTHAIGDRANSLVLGWYEDAMKAVPENNRKVAQPRWRIEHSQILDRSDIPKFKALGVIPSMQPSHAIGDLHFAVDRLGKDRLAGGYAWRSLIDSGVIIAGGSDAPVEVGDPRIEFFAATQRTDLEGYSNDAWYLNERVTAEEALKMFTLWPAYAAFEEDLTGSITVGKRADFTVFDRDIMTASGPDVLSANPVMTVVNGKVVFSAQ